MPQTSKKVAKPLAEPMFALYNVSNYIKGGVVTMRAYKFRMYLTKEQQILINKTFGCTRFIYNYFLAKKQEQYKNTKTSASAYECCKEVKDLIKEYPWLSKIDSCALRNAIFDLEDAFTNFYQKRGNYPNFKRKFGKASYRTNCITSSYKGTDYANIKVDLKNNIIKLPKLKQVKIRGYRNLNEIPGRIINATISKDASNRYYVSVIVEEPNPKQYQEVPNNIIGIDLGIKTLVTTSSGESYDNRGQLLSMSKESNECSEVYLENKEVVITMLKLNKS